MKRRISRRRGKRSSNETRRAPQSAPAPHSAQPITNGDPQAVLSEENIELMQRTYGNTATRQFVQRKMENGAHGKGCGCGVCAGGRVQRSVDLFMRQAEATDSETHGKGCSCGACGGGQMQRMTLQRDDTQTKKKSKSKSKLGKPSKKAPDPAKTAEGYYKKIIRGKDPSKSKKVDRKDMLDVMQAHLSDAQFAKAAAYLMLSVPGSVVKSKEAKTRALEILRAQLLSKEVARRLIDKQTFVVIIPRNKKMTDVDEFKGLAGKQTFDGRNWEDVRGAGGFEHNGKVYVAISEENTTGASAEGDAAGTQWCYDPGYSTTVHEIAHAVEIYGISDADKKKSEDSYAAKKQLERDGTPQEWIDGYNISDTLNLKKGKTAFGAVKTKLDTEMKALKWTAPQQQTVLDAVEDTMKNGAELKLADVYLGWLAHWKILSHNKDMLNDAAGNVLYSLDSSMKPTAGKRTECYAASHVREYWAQTATAWFGANVGNDPYTIGEWTAKKQAAKAARRNGQAEVKRIEPVLAEIMGRVFSTATIKDLNKPRKKKRSKK